jgi:hypothetical protein
MYSLLASQYLWNQMTCRYNSCFLNRWRRSHESRECRAACALQAEDSSNNGWKVVLEQRKAVLEYIFFGPLRSTNDKHVNNSTKGLRHLTTRWASTTCYRDSFTFFTTVWLSFETPDFPLESQGQCDMYRMKSNAFGTLSMVYSWFSRIAPHYRQATDPTSRQRGRPHGQDSNFQQTK